MYHYNCAVCSTPTTAERATAQYCGGPCRMKAYRQRVAAARLPRPTARESFDAKWIPNNDGCWIWNAGRFVTGYGSFRSRYAHRAAVTLYIGAIPKGHEVHHICGVRACVNPAHLEVVTAAQHHERHILDVCRSGHPLTGNGRDHLGRCRACHRERNAKYRATATEADRVAKQERIRAIRSRAQAGEDVRALAAEYGVHPTTVKRYRDGETQARVA